MFGKKQQKRRDYQAVEIRERFERNERTGKDIYARIAALKNVAREDLAHEVFMLYREAKHQSQLNSAIDQGPCSVRLRFWWQERG